MNHKELLDIVTSNMSREDAVGAIFDHCKKRARHIKETDGGTNEQPVKRKKKHKWQHDEMLVTTRGQKGRLPLTKEAINHFEKMLEAPCPNHHYPIWHAYKSYVLHRKFLTKEASSRRGLEPQRANRW